MEAKTQQLISIDESGNFSVSDPLPKVLSALPPDANLSVLSVVGKYRTGKSYLLNKVILQDNDFFQVGNTVNACTKGIWIQNKIIKLENSENTYLLVLDTEGLYSTDVSKNNDSRLFLMSILLSSLLCYNSVGMIDEYSLTDLGSIVQIGKDIVGKYSFPGFHWVIRDFVLKQQRSDGSKINSKEYLEEALKEQNGISESVGQKNQVRRMVKSFFEDRDCTCLVRPVESEMKIQMLNDVPDYQLRPEFVEQAKVLRNKIFRKVIF